MPPKPKPHALLKRLPQHAPVTFAPKPRFAPDLSHIATSIPLFGDTSAPIVLVLDPVIENLNARKPFDDKLFKWLVTHLKEGGDFSRSDIIFLSAAPPVTAEMWGQNKQMNAHLKEHYFEFHRILDALKPRMIIAAGGKAAQQVLGRSVQITKARGQVVTDVNVANGTIILPFLSPYYAQRHPDTEAVFRGDVQTAARLHKNAYDIEKSITKTHKNYRWCTDIKFLLGKNGPKRLSVDTETLGLRPYEKGNKLLTVQICYAPGEVICIPIDYDAGSIRHHKSPHWHQGKRAKIIAQLKLLLENPNVEVMGHNFKYDWQWLYQYLGIEVKNYKDDSILLAHLHDENVSAFNVDDLVRIHVPPLAGFNDILNNDPIHQKKSRMDLLPPDKMLQYACGDADATWRLVEKLKTHIDADAGLTKTYNRVSMPAMRAFGWIEQNGFPIDVKALDEFKVMLTNHQKMERVRLLNMIPKEIRDKYRNTGVGLKPNRTALLSDYLYTHPKGLKLKPVAFTKTGKPSTSSKQAMPYYAADHKFCADIIDYIKNQTLLNTFVEGFYKYIVDGKIRPTYLLFATVTGRSASRDPNGQNFPKRGKLVKAYRKIFRAPKGWVFLSNDLSQAELRIAAMMSGDETMLEVYRNDGDIHTRTAMGVMGIDTLEEWLALPAETRSLKRYQAKAVNFGFLYGMWWKKFRSYAKTDYGIDFTEAEAENIRQMFFNTYPRLESWHESVLEFVNEHGHVRTYDGRMRHLPNVFSSDEGIAKASGRQAINSPVQAMASDLGLIALGRLIPFLRAKGIDWLKVCGFIHDAIVCLVREDKAAEGAGLVKFFMENNPLTEWFGWTPEIPIKADAEVGRTLSKTYELDAELYMGDDVKGRTYEELVTIVTDKLESKVAKETDPEKLEKLIKEVAESRADALDITVAQWKVRSEPHRKIRVRPRPVSHKMAEPVRRLRLDKHKKLS